MADRVGLDWFQIATLLGAAQGFLLAAVLATQQRNRTANRLLAVAMVAFSLDLLTAVYIVGGYEQQFPHFFGVGYPLALLYGPLIYLYAVTAADRTRRLTPRDVLHFLPYVTVIVAGIPIYLMSGAEKVAFYHDLQRGLIPPLIQLVDPLKFVSGISYAVATLLFLRKHAQRVKANYSSLERMNLQWLVRLAGAAAAIWIFATVAAITGPLKPELLSFADHVVSLAVAILVYWIGYMGLRQPEIFNWARAEAPVPVSTAPVSEEQAQYERSGLTDREAAALKSALLTAMDRERPYQNSNLTLAELAERLHTTPHKLSEVLNSQLEQTFYDFVNGYRVQDVQRRIADERSKHLTILSLAIDAGFASKSTFNEVFKKHTGHTPSAYRRSLRR